MKNKKPKTRFYMKIRCSCPHCDKTFILTEQIDTDSKAEGLIVKVDK